jgi:transcriptional regulator with GAF, ATPase, and Fis domain
MAVNCAALPANLMESELLGHEKGAFTGAHTRHLGYAERAGNGVLFLDEVGELAANLHTNPLRLIERRSLQRVGGKQPIPFKARLICATNADLAARVRDGSFREDLYYRINVLSLNVPPLRERGEATPPENPLSCLGKGGGNLLHSPQKIFNLTQTAEVGLGPAKRL